MSGKSPAPPSSKSRSANPVPINNSLLPLPFTKSLASLLAMILTHCDSPAGASPLSRQRDHIIKKNTKQQSIIFYELIAIDRRNKAFVDLINHLLPAIKQPL